MNMTAINARMAILSLAAIGSAALAADNTGSKVGATLDDATITTKVRAELVATPDAKARQIDILTKGGTVFLNGFVDSDQARSQASDITGKVKGVNKVENDLQLRETQRDARTTSSDVMITTKVKAALSLNKHTEAHAIDVATYDGVVSLSGLVPSSTAKTDAEKAASSVSGVKTVKNSLLVEAT